MKRAKGLDIMATDNANENVNLKDWAGSNRDQLAFKKKKKILTYSPLPKLCIVFIHVKQKT